MTLQPLPTQEAEWSRHTPVTTHRPRHSVKLPKLTETLARLDQVELLLSQPSRVELWEKLLEVQPVLLQQRVVDRRQRLKTTLEVGQKGQQEQLRQELS